MDRLNSQNDGAQTRSWSLDLVGNTSSETLNGNAEARTLNDMHAPTTPGETMRTGRVPCCSCPEVGSTDTM